MSIQERKNLFKSAAGRATLSENFVLVVESYDVNATPPVVKGIRLDTKEEIVVSMRDVSGINKGDFKRPEIKDFAKTRKFQNDPGVLPGGTMFIQEAVKSADNTYGARWISVLSHEEGEAEVLICTAHYEGVKKGQDKKKDGKTIPGSPYSRVTVLFDGDGSHLSDEMAEKIGYTAPFTVSNVADLRIELLKLLDQNLGAGIRLKSGDAFDALFLGKNLDNTVSLEDTVDEFIAKKLPDGLEDMLAADDSMLEVIPYRAIFMGKKSAADTYKRAQAEAAAVADGKKPGKVLSKAARYATEGKDAKGQAKAQMHFGKSLVALRLGPANETTGERALFYVSVEPLFAREEYVVGLRDALSYAQTANFSPAIVFAAPAQAAAEAPAQENHEKAAAQELAAEPAPVAAAAEVAPVAAPVVAVQAAEADPVEAKLNRAPRRFQSGQRAAAK